MTARQTRKIGHSSATGRILAGKKLVKSSYGKRVTGSALTLMGKAGKVKPFNSPKPARLETTKGAVDVVIIPRARFVEIEELLEDRAAEASFHRTRDEESFPAEVANRLMDGDNPVRVFREYRGMKAKELARMVGKSPSYVSEIETGKKPGSVKVLRQIAEALGVDLENLV